MSVIAIDYGKSKCGYATGERFVLESGTVKSSEILNRIQKYDKVILGFPLSMSGNYSTQTFEVVRFGVKILNLGKKVFLIDERLTTKMAKIYSKKDDDRFSAEQLLLEYIENPNIAKELIRSKVSNEKIIQTDFALVINVPFCESFKINSGIGYTEDPYTAYTLFSHGVFVYRIFNDFLNAINSLEKTPEYIIIDKENRQILSNFKNLLNEIRYIEEFEIIKE